ncbi:hypothetical protein [Sediminibacillus massiliensis]|uniref:NrdR family transcriptional regulator n=1 Tax=Sediminibacillus massiliensis TaxID=1926277 RepID=UPI0009887371|nr:hypothetical protein [Sediminibacillus massiliensis]
MKCPICDGKTKVKETRIKERFYRRRECLSCGERFTTYELTKMDVLDILDEHLPEKAVDDLAIVLDQELPSHDIKVNIQNWNRRRNHEQQSI